MGFAKRSSHPTICCLADSSICPTGKSVGRLVTCLSSPIGKNISVFPNPKSKLYDSPSRPTEGRHAIVTAAGRDAVDADGAADEST